VTSLYRAADPKVSQQGGDSHANEGSGNLQLGFRPEPKIDYVWGLNGPDRAPNPSKKVESFALHLVGGVWSSIGPVWTPHINDVRRPKPWLQMARTLVDMTVASQQGRRLDLRIRKVRPRGPGEGLRVYMPRLGTWPPLHENGLAVIGWVQDSGFVRPRLGPCGAARFVDGPLQVFDGAVKSPKRGPSNPGRPKQKGLRPHFLGPARILRTPFWGFDGPVKNLTGTVNKSGGPTRP
jgi:hypothetical protein